MPHWCGWSGLVVLACGLLGWTGLDLAPGVSGSADATLVVAAAQSSSSSVWLAGSGHGCVWVCTGLARLGHSCTRVSGSWHEYPPQRGWLGPVLTAHGCACGWLGLALVIQGERVDGRCVGGCGGTVILLVVMAGRAWPQPHMGVRMVGRAWPRLHMVIGLMGNTSVVVAARSSSLAGPSWSCHVAGVWQVVAATTCGKRHGGGVGAHWWQWL